MAHSNPELQFWSGRYGRARPRGMPKGPGIGRSVSYSGFPPFEGLTSSRLVLLLGPPFPHPVSLLKGVQRQAELNRSFLAKVPTVICLLSGHLPSTGRAPGGGS